MKYLLLLGLLALFFFVLGLKRSRPRDPEARKPPPPAQPKPQAMLRCAECGMHLPADEALPGKGGVFCSSAHRSSHEARLGQS
ncbi:PP0621 family protein [Roseateles sp.]|uniref:PP0621 family protein n=1 Tax=Roseateles sp. TaxID=1971397 RepID=UPI0032638026